MYLVLRDQSTSLLLEYHSQFDYKAKNLNDLGSLLSDLWSLSDWLDRRPNCYTLQVPYRPESI